MKWLGAFEESLGSIPDITTLSGLISFGAVGATTDIAAGDLTMYNAVNDGNPTISLGSSATNRLEIKANYDSGAQTLLNTTFKTYTASGTADNGKMNFSVDETFIGQFLDDGLNLAASMNLSIGNVDILTDSSGTTTLNNIDALDATTEATIESAIDTLGNLTSASSLATVGTIGTGVWQGTAVASAYLDADTAHLSTNQTFTGTKTFPDIIIDGNKDISPTVTTGSMVHLSTSTLTDTDTSEEGTVTGFASVTLQGPTLAAENASITTTDAATLYIKDAPTAGTNQTITNALSLWVDSGTSRFDGDINAKSTFTFDSVALARVQTSAESFADNDTSIMTSAAIDDAIIKGGNITTIKVLPYQFMQNEDGGVNKSIQFDDTGTIGVRASSADAELLAFVEIPIGKTATSVTVYGSDTSNVVNVYEADVNASGLADKTPGGGCVVGTACDITDVASDATNYLVILVTVTATSDIVYGAAVTVSG